MILTLKVISIILTAAIVLAALLVAIEVRRLNDKLVRDFVGPLRKRKHPVKSAATPKTAPAPTPPKTVARLQELWQEIALKLDEATPEALQLGVLNLDAAIDNLLKERGFGGETMRERLQDAERSGVERIETLWQAHRVRNRLAHEPGSISVAELRETIGWYGVILRAWHIVVEK